MIDQPPRRILYIDDDPGLRRLVEREMTRRGLRVALAEDGKQGAALAAGERFDAICLDHHMPGQDGLTTLAELLRGPDPPPVIYVTGSEDGRIAVAALRAGATDYMIKDAGPEFLHLLAARIEDAIERAALRRAKAAAEVATREALARAEALARSQAVLLREVNHRVANSLQLIASLARLQEMAVTDTEARTAIGQMRARVAAVAQVHRRLYTSDDVRVVALDEYLVGLLDEIGRGMGAQERISLEAARTLVPTDHAVRLGVIVSELVTNSLKYAYPEPAGRGPIRVRLAADATHGELMVEDDGIGAAPAEAAAAPRRGGTGLGQRIVSAMASSLAGEVRQDSPGGRGTRVLVRFPLDAPS